MWSDSKHLTGYKCTGKKRGLAIRRQEAPGRHTKINRWQSVITNYALCALQLQIAPSAGGQGGARGLACDRNSEQNRLMSVGLFGRPKQQRQNTNCTNSMFSNRVTVTSGTVPLARRPTLKSWQRRTSRPRSVGWRCVKNLLDGDGGVARARVRNSILQTIRDDPSMINARAPSDMLSCIR